MSRASVARARLRGLLARHRLERELDDEVRFHLDMQIEDNVRSGMDPADARRAALRSFGGVEPMKERYRDRRAFAIVETLAQDARYAVRTLRKNPAFAATAVATLALALGANTAMFGIVNAVLLRPLPYRAPDQLVTLWTGTPDQGPLGRPAYLTADDWRRQNRSFADMAVFDPISMMLTGADGTEKISAARVSANLFSLLGVQPIQGRVFSSQEADERRRVALISRRLWETRFGASSDAIGASIELDGVRSRIVGVLPSDTDMPGFDADVWEPQTLFPDWDARRAARGEGSWFVLGRLRPSVTIERARTEMSALARALDDTLPPADRNRGISLVAMSESLVGAKPRLALWLLTGAVFVVLLIAAANLICLSLARSVGRTREMAIRAALGASPLRIARQLLVESLTLAAVSGAVGVPLAVAGIRLGRALGPANLARLGEADVDVRVLGWAVVISLVTGTLVGMAPAVALSWRRPQPAGSEDGRTVAGGLATRRARRALVVGEFALAVVLMVGAGLLIRSWQRVMGVDPGFTSERILLMALSTPEAMASAPRAGFYASVLEQVQAVPGVESAGIVGDLFVSSDSQQTIAVEGRTETRLERLRLRRDEASPDVFTTIGTRLVRGRFFSDEDGPAAPRVAIVNEAMARRLWPGSDPVGRRFAFGSSDDGRPWFTVVGVVSDMRRQGPETDPIPQVFEPLAQNPSRLETLLVRTSAPDPRTQAAAVRAAVGRVDKQITVYGVTTLEARIGLYLTERRFQTALLIAFSAVALLMAAIGIYGLIHYSVAARTQEISIRMALGARARDIFRMIVREGLQLSVGGLALGLLGALWTGQAVSGLLYGVTSADPLTFAAVSLVLTAAAATACYFPARRAMKVDPIVALRRA